MHIKTNAEVDTLIGATYQEFSSKFSLTDLPILVYCIGTIVERTRADLMTTFQHIQRTIHDTDLPIGRRLTDADSNAIWTMLHAIARNKYHLAAIFELFEEERAARLLRTQRLATEKEQRQEAMTAFLRNHIQSALNRLFQGKPEVILHRHAICDDAGPFFDLTIYGIRPVLEKHYPYLTQHDNLLVTNALAGLLDELLEVQDCEDDDSDCILIRPKPMSGTHAKQFLT